MSTRTIATTCLHHWECSDIPGMFNCLDCPATAVYNRFTATYWIED